MSENRSQESAGPTPVSALIPKPLATLKMSATALNSSRVSSYDTDPESPPELIRATQEVETIQEPVIETTAVLSPSYVIQDTSSTKSDATISRTQSSVQKNTRSISVTVYGRGSTGRVKARERRIIKRDARLEKILLYLRTHASIRNEQIVRLLHVSDATASRYAGMLIARDAIIRRGKGRGALYALATNG